MQQCVERPPRIIGHQDLHLSFWQVLDVFVQCSGLLVLALYSAAGFLVLFKSEQLPTVHGKASPCDLVLRRSPQEIPSRFLVFRAPNTTMTLRTKDEETARYFLRASAE